MYPAQLIRMPIPARAASIQFSSKSGMQKLKFPPLEAPLATGCHRPLRDTLLACRNDQERLAPTCFVAATSAARLALKSMLQIAGSNMQVHATEAHASKTDMIFTSKDRCLTMRAHANPKIACSESWLRYLENAVGLETALRPHQL